MKGWKTLLVAVGIAALGALQAGIGEVIPATWSGIALIGIGAVIAYLRTITDTAVGKKV